MRAVESSRTIASSFWLSTKRCELRTRSSFESFGNDAPKSTTENGFVRVFQSESDSYKGMVSTRVGLMRNEVAGQSEGPIGTLKIGVKSATELEIF